jgi:hypothetical protein
MDALDGETVRLADTGALSWEALTKVVWSGVLFHNTVESAVNPAPLMVRVNVGPPACDVDGEMLVIDSAGGGVMVNVEAFEPTPPALTVTLTAPAAAI